jgi:hypothetical protein
MEARLVRDRLVGRRPLGGLVAAGQPRTAVGREHEPAFLKPMRPDGGEVVHVVRQPDDDGVEVAPLHHFEQPSLPLAG